MGFKSACLSVTVLLFVAFVFISIISVDIQGTEGKGENEEIKVAKESKSSKSSPKKREAQNPYMDEYGNNEVSIGGKRFKLYEKKHLNHKKAESFCKKKDGKLAEAMNLEEMRRLQMLLLRARSISDDIWVGADKKEWKKHSMKMQRRPNFGPDPMLFGGGPTEMCPALSVSTRSLSPVMCTRELPFICENDPNQPPKQGKNGGKAKPKTVKPKSPKPTRNEGGGGSKSKRRGTVKVEMRKKREIAPSELDLELGFPSHLDPLLKQLEPQSQLQSQVLGLEEGSSLTTGNPFSLSTESDDTETVSETTEVYATESPAAAAAEHNIGFSPHVEHLQGESLLKPLIEEKAPKEVVVTNKPSKMQRKDKTTDSKSNSNSNSNPHIFHATVSTKLVVQDNGNEKDNNNNDKENGKGNGNGIGIGSMSMEGDEKTSTTYDPDQMLVDLMDEQTMNLTAIELETSASAGSVAMALNASSVSELNDATISPNSISQTQINKVQMKGLSHNLVDLIESNDLSTSGPGSALVEFNDRSGNFSNSNSTMPSVSFDDMIETMNVSSGMGNNNNNNNNNSDDFGSYNDTNNNITTEQSLVDQHTQTSQLIASVLGTTNSVPTESSSSNALREDDPDPDPTLPEGSKIRTLRNASHSHGDMTTTTTNTIAIASVNVKGEAQGKDKLNPNQSMSSTMDDVTTVPTEANTKFQSSSVVHNSSWLLETVTPTSFPGQVNETLMSIMGSSSRSNDSDNDNGNGIMNGTMSIATTDEQASTDSELMATTITVTTTASGGDLTYETSSNLYNGTGTGTVMTTLISPVPVSV